MKKTKIISILLVAVMLVGLLAGCESNVSMKDISADPKAYIDAGLKKSFSSSPLGDIIALENSEAVALDATITPVNEELGHIKFNSIAALQELAIWAKLDADLDGEKIKGEFFLDENNIAINSELLKEVFGSESIGLRLSDDLYTRFTKSNWYEILVIDSGLEDELKNDNGSTIDAEAIVNLIVATMEEIEKIHKESIKYEVVESEIEIDGKSLGGYLITKTMDDYIKEKYIAAIEKFSDELQKLLPEELAAEIAEEIEFMIEDIEESTKSIAETATYFIAKKGGALIEMTYDAKMETVDTWSDKDVVNTVKFKVNFGTNPETIFSPNFEAEANIDGDKYTIVGKSEIDIKAKSLKLDVEAKVDYPEEYEWLEDKTATATLTIDMDGNYKLAAKYDDEEVEFDGKLKIEGTTIEWTFDIDEGEDAVQFVIKADFSAKKPIAFKYEDLLIWDEERVQEFLEKIS